MRDVLGSETPMSTGDGWKEGGQLGKLWRCNVRVEKGMPLA